MAAHIVPDLASVQQRVLTCLHALHDKEVLLASIGDVLGVMTDADGLDLAVHVCAGALTCHCVQVPQRH